MALDAKPISNELTDPNSIRSRWGILANEYEINGETVDLQDLMVMITKNRAARVEGEVSPLSTRIRKRNSRLDELGNLLGELTGIQTSFTKDDGGGTWSTDHNPNLSYNTQQLLNSVQDGLWARNDDGRIYITKSNCEKALSLVKSKIDGLNNEAQLDMSRMQNLVDNRDQAFSAATNLMTSISDTRANVIRNF